MKRAQQTVSQLTRAWSPRRLGRLAAVVVVLCAAQGLGVFSPLDSAIVDAVGSGPPHSALRVAGVFWILISSGATAIATSGLPRLRAGAGMYLPSLLITLTAAVLLATALPAPLTASFLAVCLTTGLAVARDRVEALRLATLAASRIEETLTGWQLFSPSGLTDVARALGDVCSNHALVKHSVLLEISHDGGLRPLSVGRHPSPELASELPQWKSLGLLSDVEMAQALLADPTWRGLALAIRADGRVRGLWLLAWRAVDRSPDRVTAQRVARWMGERLEPALHGATGGPSVVELVHRLRAVAQLEAVRGRIIGARPGGLLVTDLTGTVRYLSRTYLDDCARLGLNVPEQIKDLVQELATSSAVSAEQLSRLWTHGEPIRAMVSGVQHSAMVNICPITTPNAAAAPIGLVSWFDQFTKPDDGDGRARADDHERRLAARDSLQALTAAASELRVNTDPETQALLIRVIGRSARALELSLNSDTELVD